MEKRCQMYDKMKDIRKSLKKNVSKMCAEKMENVFKKSDKEQFQDFRKCRPKITQAKITQVKVNYSHGSNRPLCAALIEY